MVNYYPSSLSEALEILEKEKVIVMGGGSDLMVRFKKGAGVLPAFEKALMFTKNIKEIKEVKIENNRLYLGAGVSLRELSVHPDVPELLKKVILQMASPGIRSEATLAGNIANASPAGDSLPFLYCRNADLTLSSVKGNRTLSVFDFIKGPGRKDLLENEMITSILIPVESFDSELFRKIGGRKSDVISKLSFTGMTKREDDRITDIRIAFGAVAATIIRKRELEESLISAINQKDKKAVDNVLSSFRELITPIDDQRSTAAYRKTVACNLLESFIGSCLDE